MNLQMQKFLLKDLQIYIWKKIFTDMLRQLRKMTALINSISTERYQGPYSVKMLERTLFFKWIRFNDQGWGLGLQFGNRVSNYDQINAAPYYCHESSLSVRRESSLSVH